MFVSIHVVQTIPRNKNQWKWGPQKTPIFSAKRKKKRVLFGFSRFHNNELLVQFLTFFFVKPKKNRKKIEQERKLKKDFPNDRMFSISREKLWKGETNEIKWKDFALQANF